MQIGNDSLIHKRQNSSVSGETTAADAAGLIAKTVHP